MEASWGHGGWCAHDHDPGYRWVRESVLDGASARRLVVIGKNPSTADHVKPDPTSLSVQRWAAANGFGQVCLVNLFALRSSRPRDLEVRDGIEVQLEKAVGPGNDEVLLRETAHADAVVAAWGGPKELRLVSR